ncbi:hypothetical protein H9623_13135 [Oerskovia sp. Sa1BUA8]|uniref:Uncharacterized protein n=1 Tax=Oerskovia douganii TaxID=2762210 RepID=A0A9D5UB16_9CELL|nr:hypothetical protein [Oerskovia douganii]MBE7701240.1 hypothetical protein [Oerskovia douganii]
MKISAPRQRLAVSEGMALGLLMCGREHLDEPRWLVDLAFEDVFPRWAYSGDFSQVVTDLRNGTNGAIVMTRADARKKTFSLCWEPDGPELWIRSRAGDEVSVSMTTRMIDGDVPAEGWHELAEAFLDHLDMHTNKA